MGGAVVALHHALGIFEDRVFVFHQVVGRQAALALPHAHAAARGYKAHADGAGGFDAVVQRDAVGVDVEVVAAGSAAAEQQLGHGDLGAGVNHVGREAPPNRVRAAQPAKQLGVLYRRNRPCERLVHMVMGVDQTGNEQVVARVNHHVRRVRQHVRRPDGRNLPVAHQHRGVVQLAARIVLGGHRVGVVDEQGGHAGIVPQRFASSARAGV